MKKLLFCLVMMTSFGAADAWAQGTPEQREACHDDAYKYCSWEIPDVPAIEQCLLKYMSYLSPACRAQFNDGPRKGRH